MKGKLDGGGCRCRSPALQDREELFLIKWFAEIIIHPCRETLLAVAFYGVGGEGDNGQVREVIAGLFGANEMCSG